MIDSIFNAVGNIAGAVMSMYGIGKNYQSQRETNEANAANVRETNKANKDINQANLDYNKAMTQAQWERDDNAHQREVADLEAAGLSPLANMSGSANGSPLGAPNAIPMESFKAQAPQLDMNSLVQSILQSKALDETKRHNLANEKYKEMDLANSAEELKQNAEKLNLQNKELDNQIKKDAALIELQNKQIEETIRSHKKDEQLRLSENETRIMAEESQRFLQEVQSQAGGKDVPYEVLDDFEIYSNRMRLYTVEYNNFIKELEATSKSSATSQAQGGGARVDAVGVVGVGVNGNGSESSYSSENISKKQEAMLQKFRQTHKVPVYIPKGKYKSIKTTNY